MSAIGTPLLALALLVPAAPPEKPVDYEKELNDKLGAGIKPEENANAKLFLAFGPKPEGGVMPAEFYRRLGIAEPPENGDYLIGIGKFGRDRLQLDPNDLDMVFKQQGWASARPWAALDYPFVAAWVTANTKPLELVHEAVKRPKYYNPLVSRRTADDPGSLIGVLLPNVQKCREIAALLSARAMLRVQEGKLDDAWADILTCHRLGRHCASGGTLIEMLVGIAIDSIASNAAVAFLDSAKLTSAEVLTKLKDLQALPPFPKVADKLDLTERTMFLDCIRLLKRGGLGNIEGIIGGTATGKLTDEEKKALDAIDYAPARVSGMKWYDRMVFSLKKPTRAERLQDMNAIEAELKDLKQRYVGSAEKLREDLLKKDPGPAVGQAIGDLLIAMLAPALQRMMDASDRQAQHSANVQVAFAIKAFHLDRRQYPAKLADLAPKYLKAIPRDVYSDGALLYKPEANGFRLYSVGANGKDDDGRWFDDEPRGDDPRVILPLPPLKKD